MGTNTVRRNLFHHNLSRRPASGVSANATTQGGSDGISSLSSRILGSASSDAGVSLKAGSYDNGEIVAKDKNGNYKLDIPLIPPFLHGENGDRLESVDEGGGAGAVAVGRTGEADISGCDKQKIEVKLADIMGRNRRNGQMSNGPAEVLNLIHQNLRDKVAALEEDNWMYDGN